MPLEQKKIAALREHIKIIASNNEESALEEIARMNAETSLPVIIAIVEDLKKLTEEEIEQLFFKITKTELKKPKQKLDEVIKRILGSEIKTIFETFIKCDITEVTELNIKELTEQTVNDFCDDSNLVDFQEDEQMSLFKDLFRTEIFIATALALYKDADWRQNAPKWQLAPMLLYKEDDLRKPFLAVSHCATTISVLSETKELWEEYITWLHGLYLRTYNQMPKNVDGSVKRDDDGRYPYVEGDDQDKNLKERFKIVKYDIALYHLATQEALEMIVRPQQKTTQQPEIKSPSEPSVIPPQVVSIKIKKYLLIDLPTENGGKIPEGLEAFSKVIPNAKIQILSEEEFINQHSIFTQRQTIKVLKEYKEEEPNRKFPKLISYIKKEQLNADQIEDMKNFKQVILSRLGSYVNSSYTTTGFPAKLFGMGRPHEQLVKKNIEEIKKMNDAKEIFKALYSLWNKMVAENSVEMQSILTKLLHDGYALILDDLKLADERDNHLMAV